MIACLCRHHAAAQVHGIGQRLLDNRCQVNGLLVNFTYHLFFVYRQFSGMGGGSANQYTDKPCQRKQLLSFKQHVVELSWQLLARLIVLRRQELDVL